MQRMFSVRSRLHPAGTQEGTTSTFPPGYVRQLEDYIASLELQLGQSDPEPGNHFPSDISTRGMGASNVVEMLRLPSDEPSNLDIAEIPDWISGRMGEGFPLVLSLINTFTPPFVGQAADFPHLPNPEIEPGIDDDQNEDQEDIETSAQADNDVDPMLRQGVKPRMTWIPTLRCCRARGWKQKANYLPPGHHKTGSRRRTCP